MIRLSQGISECHVDEESSRAADLSELGEDVGRYGNSSHVIDAPLGSRYVATMADVSVSGHSQTSSSGEISQRRHGQELQQHDGGGNSGTMMTRMVDYKQLGGNGN